MHNKPTLYLILIFCSMFFSSSIFSSSRYPDESTKQMIPPVEKQADIVCKCDPTNDPCCTPPTGGSSNKTTDPDQIKNTDVSKCKCDLINDPCCKRLPGTTLIDRKELKKSQ